MIKASRYLAQRVSELGVKHVFMITGGGAMHLNDAFGKTPGLNYICTHHEQAAAMAAEGYARANERVPGVAVVTSGPGGTNAITGVLGCWLDSVPAIFISGNVRYATTVASTGLPLRQLGDQEANIAEIVRTITKYSVMISDPGSVRYHFEKAAHLARSGRPGPVWLDVPLDVQSAMIDPDAQRGYVPEPESPAPAEEIRAAVTETLDRIDAAKRPVILAGGGIRMSGARDLFRTVVDRLGIPVQTAITAIDLLESEHPLHAGRPGICGDRPSNFIVQNCDLLLSLGSRLWVRLISYNFDAFARAAFKIAVDIDEPELRKPTVKIDRPVHCDVRAFLEEMLRQLETRKVTPKTDWIAWGAERKRRYPVVLPEMRAQKRFVNSYYFVERLSAASREDDLFVTGDGTAYTGTWQAMTLRRGQRMFTNSGCAAMGYDVPAAIGACFALDKRRVICITGDGSVQMNLQEFQTIAAHKLPIKLFLLNNGGYLAIRSTQDSYFPGGYVGADPSSGVTIPDMQKIAHAYGIPSTRVDNHGDLDAAIARTLEEPGPALCELMMDPRQELIPRLASEVTPDGKMISKPLEDLYPFLPRAEFLENMLIPLWSPK